MGDIMITCAGRSMSNVMQYRGLSTDVISDNGKYITNNDTVNKKIKNGDELYCFDNGNTYLYDEENETLILQ